MSWFKKLMGSFNAHNGSADTSTQQPSAEPEQPTGYIAQHGAIMRTCTFTTQRVFSFEEMLTGKAPQTTVRWEATMSPTDNAVWSLRQIETCGDFTSEGATRDMSFEEALNIMALMEEHQASLTSHEQLDTHAQLGDESFSALARKEGFVQTSSGYVDQQTFDTLGTDATSDAITQARQELLVVQSQQESVFNHIFASSGKVPSRLTEAALALKAISAIKENILYPLNALSSHLSMIDPQYENSYVSYIERITQAYKGLQDYVQSNPGDVFSQYDQQQMSRLLAGMEVEAFTLITQNLFEYTVAWPTTQRSDLLIKLNTHLQDVAQNYVTDTPPHFQQYVEDKIMSKRPNPKAALRFELNERVRTQLGTWAGTATEQVGKLPTPAAASAARTGQALLR